MTKKTTTERKNPLGPVGETVQRNVRRVRESKRLQFTELSRKLEEIGRPIAPLGLRRIEAGERRVDSDDLVALALALDVSPATLLMPESSSPTDNFKIVAGYPDVSARRLWRWLTAAAASAPASGVINIDHLISSRPRWVTDEETEEAEHFGAELWRDHIARLEQRMDALEGNQTSGDD